MEYRPQTHGWQTFFERWWLPLMALIAGPRNGAFELLPELNCSRFGSPRHRILFTPHSGVEELSASELVEAEE